MHVPKRAAIGGSGGNASTSNGSPLVVPASAAAAGAPAATGGLLACTLKFLASEALVAAIIGKGGSVIASMRTSCKARLQFSDYGDVYPGTELRVLTASANEEENLNSIVDQILVKLGEVAAEHNDTENVGTEKEMTIRLLVPRSAVGSLIGKGGTNIKELRESSATKVTIQDASVMGPGADQVVTVTGEPEGIKTVLQHVNSDIQSFKDEPWFPAWATQPGTVPWNLSSITGTFTGGTVGASSSSSGVDLMLRVAQGLPPYVIEDSRGFAVSCVVPNNLVGGLIGRGGTGTREITNLTGAKIKIREIADDPENRALHIFGPLPATCAAYMLMMKRYLDVEQQSTTW